MVRHQADRRPLRPHRGAIPQLGDARRCRGPERRRRLQGRARALSSLCVLCLPLGASHSDLPCAEKTRSRDLGLRRPLAHGGTGLELRARPRRRARSDQWRALYASGLHGGGGELFRPRHRAGAVGQGEEHDRQQRVARNHPHAQQRVRRSRRGGRRRGRRRVARFLSRGLARRNRCGQRARFSHGQQRRLQSGLRHRASRL